MRPVCPNIRPIAGVDFRHGFCAAAARISVDGRVRLGPSAATHRHRTPAGRMSRPENCVESPPITRRYDGSDVCPSRALSLTRNAPRAQALMAVCHWLSGDKNQAAEKELIRLARAHPRVHYSHCYLATLYLEHGQLDEAEVVLRRALETESACHTARSNQAILRFKRETIRRGG